MDNNRTEEIGQRIQQWIRANRDNLPLNVDSWEIMIEKSNGNASKKPELSFGNYNASSYRVDNFYKPFSRIVEIKNEE